MSGQDYSISLSFTHRVRFTRHAFTPENPVWNDLLKPSPSGQESRVLVLIEEQIAHCFPHLIEEIRTFLFQFKGIRLAEIQCLPGGESVKNNTDLLNTIWDRIEYNHIDRHSYLFAIGGGAFLDVAGFAASTAHRGVRIIRFPTTVLSQDDSGVGVKNGINAYQKKNFLGTFHVPYAVINDFSFLSKLPAQHARSGLIEALKVALVKDEAFFQWISQQAKALAELQQQPLEEAIERSALLHAQHIAYGHDPFEMGSSRPLDYGHWSAHKLEQLSGFTLSHGDAVAIGLALDTLYAVEIGLLKRSDAEDILRIIQTLQLPLWHSALDLRDPSTQKRLIFDGLEEFREHLGGELTLILLKAPGDPIEVNEVSYPHFEAALKTLSQEALTSSP